MKKNYLLSITLALFVSLAGSSQSFDFNTDNDLEGWESRQNTVLSGPTDGALKVTIQVRNDITPTNPDGGYTNGSTQNTFRHLDAKFDTSTGKYLKVRMKNTTPNTNVVFFMQDPGNEKNVTFAVAPSSDEFITYYTDMSGSAGWTGVLSKIVFRLRLNTYDADATKELNEEAASGDVYIDEISITNDAPIVSGITNYNFNDDNGGWLAKNYCQLSDPVDGSSKINIAKDPNQTPTDPNGGYERGNPGNQFYHETANLDTSVGNFLNIRLRNNTLNTRVVFFMLDNPGNQNVNIPLVASDTEFTTYTYDMTGVPAWTGILNKITMRFRLHDYDPNGTSDLNTEVATGELFIDDISITNMAPLSTDSVDFKDDSSISVYPNPANDVISINSARNINKIEVYNILGQLQKVNTKNLNSMDVSSFSKGVYILKFYQNAGIVSTKRFVKN